MNKELLKGHLPILILGLLDEQPLHGYALCETLASRGAAQLQLSEGTVYPLLHRLERQGHVRSKWEAGTGGKPRKIYSITASGKKQIAQHKADWQELLGLYQLILGKRYA